MNASEEATYEYLKQKYNRLILSKKELAVELNLSLSTIDLYLSRGIGLPRYKKLGTAKNARVIFALHDIVTFLNSDQIETM